MKLYLDKKLVESFDVSPTPMIVVRDGVYYQHRVENVYESVACLLISGNDKILLNADNSVAASSISNNQDKKNE